MQELDRHKSCSNNRLAGKARKAVRLLFSCFTSNHPRVRCQTMEEVYAHTYNISLHNVGYKLYIYMYIMSICTMQTHTEVHNMAIENNDDRILHCCLLYQLKTQGLSLSLSLSRAVQKCSLSCSPSSMQDMVGWLCCSVMMLISAAKPWGMESKLQIAQYGPHITFSSSSHLFSLLSPYNPLTPSLLSSSLFPSLSPPLSPYIPISLSLSLSLLDPFQAAEVALSGSTYRQTHYKTSSAQLEDTASDKPTSWPCPQYRPHGFLSLHPLLLPHYTSLCYLSETNRSAMHTLGNGVRVQEYI